MIKGIIDEIKVICNTIETLNDIFIGDIRNYDNSHSVQYPICNLDVVDATVTNFAQEYRIRVYICDRNEPYIAYNKTELILNKLFKSIDIEDKEYTINYFTLDFKDQVNGVWADITITRALVLDCVEEIISCEPIIIP